MYMKIHVLFAPCIISHGILIEFGEKVLCVMKMVAAFALSSLGEYRQVRQIIEQDTLLKLQRCHTLSKKEWCAILFLMRICYNRFRKISLILI